MSLHDDFKPVIAVLTMHDNQRGFRGNHQNFLDIIQTGESMGYQVYIVTVRDLDVTGPTVMGYTYNKGSGKWTSQSFPLPHVLYNRIPYREDERKPSVQRKIEECKQAGIELYNPFFFNKWDLFEWLKKSKSTQRLIPHTRRMRSASTLGMVLRTFPYLYLKPESGKAGKGIMMLKFQEKERLPFRLKIQSSRKSTTYKAATLAKLWTRIRRETGHTPYIMQQGIELASSRKRPFDLRVLVQKNGKGQWSVTGIGARLAGSRSITTHVPRGGSVEDPEQLLTELFGEETTAALMKRVKSTSLMIARQVERGSGHTLGEMSMDLGIDDLGEIWFFEANAKPMKFDEPQIRKRSLERIFQYSAYLARQSKR
ncbi:MULTISPECIES: YheC/YheD family protein [Paenibacillus]|uniref:YheC/YheD family protein n=1 Tax=Paenibacillus xylanilyticus TaxID=248903 RepID=A0A7Y6C5B8_9BACL|nr:YheC/YheD family protein [Paenibacillus xylanilyticus]NUU80105.1 YheC/YheD family protein [Paenibacillus xylanilyticus]